jgi:hypothetical protein
MKTFRDVQEREWTVEVNVAALKRVKDSTDVDLTRLVDPEADVISKLSEDVFLLFDVICALLKPQLEKHGLSAEEFGAGLDEESTEKAATALFEGIIDFFREDKRTLLKRAFSKVKAAAESSQSEALNRAMKEVESETFDEAIRAAMSGGSSTSSPESSVSTPAPSP